MPLCHDKPHSLALANIKLSGRNTKCTFKVIFDVFSELCKVS